VSKRAAIYCRISKDSEGLGLGVERQEKACRDLAQRRKLDVAHVFTDNDISAYKRRKRPGYEAMVEAIKAGEIDTVVAWAPDRLTRQTRDLEDLIDLLSAHDVGVETCQSGVYDLTTPSGQMSAMIVGSVAKYESAHRSARLRAKSDELAARGLPAGGRAAYGYRWEHADRDRGKGRLLIDATEAKHLRWMADRALDGWSVLRIARELDRKGVPTKEGRPWHSSTVRSVLINPTVAGLRVHRREVAGPAAWKPILERDKWERIVATLADPARKRRRPARKYLLAGLVESAKGDRMNGKPEADGRTYYATRPARAGTGDAGATVPALMSLSISSERLEEFVTEAVLVALRDFKPDAPQVDNEAADEVVQIEHEMAELATLRGERTISMAEWLAARQPLEAALAEARARAGGSAPARPTMLDAPDVRSAWAKATIDDRRKVVAAVVDKIVIDKATRGRWTPIAERVRIVWKA
jgi:site-specific DNA recombinase